MEHGDLEMQMTWGRSVGLLCLDVNDWLLVWLFISNRRQSRWTVYGGHLLQVPRPSALLP